MSSRKIAVIGSGFGGMAAAIRLQTEGHRVTLFDKREKPGGRAYVYQDQGFTFDAGPTVITAPDCLRELFTGAGRRMEDYVELLPVNPLYRLHWEDGSRFDYTADLEETLRQIARKSPQDAVRYPEFLRYTEQVFEAGYTELAHVPFLHWSTMIRVSPELIKLRAYRSVYQAVSKYIQDPQLRQAFSFHSLLVGGNPFSASSIYTLIHFLERKWGVFFPKGGTHAMVRALVKLLTELGGEYRGGTEIARILTGDGKVEGIETTSGERESFDAVVSNADVMHTYGKLLDHEPKVRLTRTRLKHSRYSMSLCLVYFGTRRQYPELAHHNVIFGARYRELLTDIFKRGKLADDFSLYLHAPTHSDPDLAPPGGESFYALSPVPHLGKADIDWSEEGPRYADKILRYLEDRYLPGLSSEIVTQRIFTPADFSSELNAHMGNAFSLEPLLTQSAYFRVHNRDARLKGLYFVGAGTHPGAGIPGVVSSAKATSGVMLEDFRTERATQVAVPAAVVASEAPSMEVVAAECRDRIAVGSKSFTLASTLFRPEMRDAACFLYAWCRHCDDQVDETHNLRLQEERVRELKRLTSDAFAEREVSGPVFTALRHLAGKYRIPEHYALELLEGMSMDVRKERYWTLEELLHYCYRVAGVVGLMMVHVMGVSDEAALRRASDLGSAMQLTNIARDVMDDARMGRVYLPLAWLDEAGVPEGQIAHPKYRAEVANVVRRLLREATRYYRSGRRGLKYLPWRAAIAVAVAGEVYSDIGTIVLRRGAAAWDRRAVTSKGRKLWAVARGLARVVGTVPYRLLKPWRAIHLTTVWKFQLGAS